MCFLGYTPKSVPILRCASVAPHALLTSSAMSILHLSSLSEPSICPRWQSYLPQLTSFLHSSSAVGTARAQVFSRLASSCFSPLKVTHNPTIERTVKKLRSIFGYELRRSLPRYTARSFDTCSCAVSTYSTVSARSFAVASIPLCLHSLYAHLNALDASLRWFPSSISKMLRSIISISVVKSRYNLPLKRDCANLPALFSALPIFWPV